MKELGVVSHFVAQRDKLVSWLGGAGEGQRLRHAVVVRVFDDTNVWVAPCKRALPNVQAEAEAAGEQPAEEAENRGKKTAGKLGKRKVSPLLGIVQKIFVRGPDSESPMDFARVHAPSHVLPKAGLSK